MMTKLLLQTGKRLVHLLMTGIILTSMVSPVGISAQIENLSKSPNLSVDIAEIQEYEPLDMPADYPEDLVEHFDENVDARSFVVIDVETNRILAQRQANIPYPIASMSKVMSAYLVLKAVDEGTISMDTMIEAPAEITDVLSGNFELSSANLFAGEEYTVKDLLYGVMMLSGNDATSVLMWHLYGSEQAGTQAIIDQLYQWGFTDYEFYTTSGIPNLYLPESWWMPGSVETSENKMSAQDVALMSEYVVTEYPELLQITASEDYVFMEGTDLEQYFYTTNLLLPGQAHGREGINGLKSGTTDAAGKNFVATGTENGREIIAVAMGLFPRDDGLEITSYWDIEILLEGLEEYPDLHENADLPVNSLPTLEERQAQQAEEARLAALEEEGSESDAGDEPFENRRDNPITNFIGRLFKWLN